MSIQTTAFKQALKYLMGAEKKFIDKRSRGLANKLVPKISEPLKPNSMLIAEGKSPITRSVSIKTNTAEPVSVFGTKPYNELSGQHRVDLSYPDITIPGYEEKLFTAQNDFGNRYSNILDILRPYTRGFHYIPPVATAAGIGGYNLYQDEEERKKQEALRQMLGG